MDCVFRHNELYRRIRSIIAQYFQLWNDVDCVTISMMPTDRDYIDMFLSWDRPQLEDYVLDRIYLKRIKF